MKRKWKSALIVLFIGVLILTAGIFCARMPIAGSALHDRHAAAQAAGDARTAAGQAIADVVEEMARAVSRSETAVADAQAALETVRQNEAALSSGEFAEDDIGRLGTSISAAEAAGTGVADISGAFADVYRADGLDALDGARASVEKAEKTVGSACEQVNAAIGEIGSFAAEDSIARLPAEPPAAPTPLPDDPGEAAQVLVARAETALQAAQQLQRTGLETTAALSEILRAHPVNFRDSFVLTLARFAVDIIVVGALLVLWALMRLCWPATAARLWSSKFFRHGTYLVVAVALATMALIHAPGETWALMRQGVFDTLYMTVPATIFAYVLGLPLGILLVITGAGHIRQNASFNAVLGTIINFLRSIPFVILLVLLFDVTRLVMGSAIGTRSIIFPLFVSAFPFVARMVEGSLNEVDRGVIEAAESMGSGTMQIICKVLLPEALPSLINGAALCMTTILAYTAMAGAAGGDGLGKIAITYGLNYRNYEIMYTASILLVALVQIIQIAGDMLTRAIDHRKK